MRGIWAVAKQTLAQCLRMKVAVAFIVLLAAILCALPFVVEGDGTLAGRIRTLLAYGTSATSVLLSLVTIFLAVGVVSSDVRRKQIYMVATKPLARWQYVVGRWLGVVLLDALLLAVAAAAIYATAQHMREAKAEPNDRQAVETEVFAARDRVQPEPLDIEDELTERLEKMAREGRYQEAVESLQSQKGIDEKQAQRELQAEVRKQILEEKQSARPGGSLRWDFSAIDVSKSESRASGEIRQAVKLSARREDRPGRLVLDLRAPPSFVGTLIYNGPVEVDGFDARVTGLGEDRFEARLVLDDALARRARKYEKGRSVRLLSESVVQLKYELTPLGSVPGREVHGTWIARRPGGAVTCIVPRDDPVRMASTLTLPASVVAPDGRTQVIYHNRSPASVLVRQEDLSILYRVGGFEWNYLRSVLLVMIRMMFLAAIGVFAGSFLSFAVGSVVCFAVLPFGVARDFLADAVTIPGQAGEGLGPLSRIGGVVFQVMRVLLPDLGSTSPTDALVDGMFISWLRVGSVAGWTLALRGALILAVACVIFHKRELARVQV